MSLLSLLLWLCLQHISWIFVLIAEFSSSIFFFWKNNNSFTVNLGQYINIHRTVLVQDKRGGNEHGPRLWCMAHILLQLADASTCGAWWFRRRRHYAPRQYSTARVGSPFYWRPLARDPFPTRLWLRLSYIWYCILYLLLYHKCGNVSYIWCCIIYLLLYQNASILSFSREKVLDNFFK